MKNYKIGIIGLGSIANRHIINISRFLKKHQVSYAIDVIRSKGKTAISKDIESIIENVYYSFEDVPNNYDIMFITNPTSLHYDTIKKYSFKTKHMFIEKPIFDNIYEDIEALNLSDEQVYYVACPLRYTNVIQYLKSNIDISSVYSARIICSSYLPDWRPNIDYRETYSARKDMGGGVSIDLIHEWDYIHYLFGKPNEVINFKGTYSDLEIDSDDISIYIAKYESMLLELHLDYFGRKPIREIQLFTKNDTIVGDLINSSITFLNQNKTISFGERRDDYQEKEIEYFFDLIEGNLKNHNSIIDAIEILKIAKEGKI